MKQTLHAILTGDIVSSRKADVTTWLPVLQESLAYYSNNFDIFRGDSFQISLPIERCMEALFYIKAKMRSIQPLDVRMGLGIGEIEYQDLHIKNSTGQALIYSGEAFDRLDKELIYLKTPWADFDELANIMLQLSMELAGRWTLNMSQTIAAIISNPEANQHDIAQLLGRKYQSQISNEINNANWPKIKLTIDYCTSQLKKRC